MFLDFECIENARELGGLARLDGAHIRPGRLLRSGQLGEASDGDIQKLSAMGISAVVDFRDDNECADRPDRLVPGAAYYHFPALPDLSALFPPPEDGQYDTKVVHEQFRSIYRYLVRTPESHTAYMEFFQILLRAKGAPVLWHCTQGKDRAGGAAMLLMAALGFEEEQIIREYMRTNEYMQPALADYALEHTKNETDLAREDLLVFQENARYFLDCLRLDYGSVQHFLEMALDVGPAEIRVLEQAYMVF